MRLPQRINPKTDPARRGADHFAIHNLQAARVAGVGVLPLIKIAIDRGHGRAQRGVHKRQLFAQRAETQRAAPGVNGVQLQIAPGAIHAHHVNRPGNLGHLVIHIENARFSQAKGAGIILATGQRSTGDCQGKN